MDREAGRPRKRGGGLPTAPGEGRASWAGWGGSQQSLWGWGGEEAPAWTEEGGMESEWPHHPGNMLETTETHSLKEVSLIVCELYLHKAAVKKKKRNQERMSQVGRRAQAHPQNSQFNANARVSIQVFSRE